MRIKLYTHLNIRKRFSFVCLSLSLSLSLFHSLTFRQDTHYEGGMMRSREKQVIWIFFFRLKATWWLLIYGVDSSLFTLPADKFIKSNLLLLPSLSSPFFSPFSQQNHLFVCFLLTFFFISQLYNVSVFHSPAIWFSIPTDLVLIFHR